MTRPAHIPTNPAELVAWIEDNGIEMVNLRVTDLNGFPWAVSGLPEIW